MLHVSDCEDPNPYTILSRRMTVVGAELRFHYLEFKR